MISDMKAINSFKNQIHSLYTLNTFSKIPLCKGAVKIQVFVKSVRRNASSQNKKTHLIQNKFYIY